MAGTSLFSGSQIDDSLHWLWLHTQDFFDWNELHGAEEKENLDQIFPSNDFLFFPEKFLGPLVDHRCRDAQRMLNSVDLQTLWSSLGVSSNFLAAHFMSWVSGSLLEK